jgi:microcin C transport system substrate-binding protein
MVSRYMDEWFVHWIDEDLQEETRAALRNGRTFPPEIRVFDQYREPAGGGAGADAAAPGQ